MNWSQDFRNVTIGLLCCSLIASSVVISRTVVKRTEKLPEVIDNVNGASLAWRVYSEKQTAQLESPKTQKAIEAAIEVGAAAKGSLLLVNTQLLPRAWKEVDALHVATDKLAAFTEHTDTSVNQTMMPELARLLHNLGDVPIKLGVDMDTIAEALKLTSQNTGLTLQAVQKRIADPRFDQLFDQVLTGTAHLVATAAQIEEASKRLPEIAEALAKISKTTSRFTKAYWIARILSILIPLIP
jgi:hypothetical protein